VDGNIDECRATMTARHRGDQRIHSRWRPQPSELAAPKSSEPPAVDARPSPTEHVGEPKRIRWRRITVVISVALLILAVVAAAHNAATKSTRGRRLLPSTPAAWVQQFTASAVDQPTDVCHHLFAPALAAAFKADTGDTCLAYYRQIDSPSYRVRRTLQDGPSAAVEAQQLGHGRTFGYFTILLSHLDRGWQAIDIVPGGTVRPR
jgi:hypothetical protein